MYLRIPVNIEYKVLGGHSSPLCALVSDINTHNHLLSKSPVQEGEKRETGLLLGKDHHR